jgi:hypothetical protein
MILKFVIIKIKASTVKLKMKIQKAIQKWSSEKKYHKNKRNWEMRVFFENYQALKTSKVSNKNEIAAINIAILG